MSLAAVAACRLMDSRLYLPVWCVTDRMLGVIFLERVNLQPGPSNSASPALRVEREGRATEGSGGLCDYEIRICYGRGGEPSAAGGVQRASQARTLKPTRTAASNPPTPPDEAASESRRRTNRGEVRASDAEAQRRIQRPPNPSSSRVAPAARGVELRWEG